MAYYDDELDQQNDPFRPRPGRRVPQGTPSSPAASPAFGTTPNGNAPQTQLPTDTPPPPVTPGPDAPAPSPAFPPPRTPRTPRTPFNEGGFRTPTQDEDGSLPGRVPAPGVPNLPNTIPPAGLPPTDTTKPPTDGGTGPTPPTNDGWANPPADGNWEQWFLTNVKSLPPTPQSLISIEAQLGKHGIKVLRNAEGTAGKIQLPNGQIIDVILAAGLGGRGWQWMTPEQAGQGEAQPGGASAAAPPTLGQWSSNLSAAGLTSFQEQVRQMILQQLAGASKPVDPNAPDIRQPIDAAERRAEEIRRRRQSADAERLTQRGLGDSGALDTARRQGFEDMSQTISGVTAQIIGEQMQNKRRELVTLLQTAMASGDADAARQVQMQLAQIDAELRRLGLKQQHEQFQSSQAQQQGQFDSTMDYNWAQFQAGLL